MPNLVSKILKVLYRSICSSPFFHSPDPFFKWWFQTTCSECVQGPSGFPGSPGHLFRSSSRTVHISMTETTINCKAQGPGCTMDASSLQCCGTQATLKFWFQYPYFFHSWGCRSYPVYGLPLSFNIILEYPGFITNYDFFHQFRVFI